MAGTKFGGLKAAETNRLVHGDDFYSMIGRKGGMKGHKGGFASNPELARLAGAKGGRNSKRGSKYDFSEYEDDIIERFKVKGQSIKYIAKKYNVSDRVIKKLLSDKGALSEEYTKVKNYYKKSS